MIEVNNLSKQYGELLAIQNVSFRVKKGDILGFLGPNGAGKTTTMRIITGYIPATQGTVTVAGYDVFASPMEVKKRIGYLPEIPPLYQDMTVSSYLDFVARIKEIPKKQIKTSMDEALEKCGLTEVYERVIDQLSKGFKQRVGIAQAIIHKPEVLILDEPTIGLDPKQIIEIRSLIKSLAGEQTIILSTHILQEVTMVCDRVIIIDRGKIVIDDTLRNLTEGDKGQIFVQLSNPDKNVVSLTYGKTGDLFAISMYSEIFRSSDNGKTWRKTSFNIADFVQR